MNKKYKYISNHFIATKKESEIRKFSWPVFQGYVRESPHKIGQTYGTVPQLYGLEIPTDIFIQLISMDIAAIYWIKYQRICNYNIL